jgi:hypothetical protein
MADRYWVGGTASWDATAGTKWATSSGGSGGASVPTASDDVFFDGNSGSGTVTMVSGRVCRNLDFTGFTGTLAGGGGATSTISGSLTVGAGMTFTLAGAMTFNATTTGHTITLNGKTLTNTFTFNGTGGGWTFQDDYSWTGGGNLVINIGAVDFNGKTFVGTNGGLQTFGTGVKSLTTGGASFTGTLINAAGTNFTLTDTGTTWTVTGTVLSFAGGTAFGTIVSNSNVTVTLNTNATINNFTRTSSGVNSAFSLAGDLTVTGTLTLTGGSDSLRLHVLSNTKGTQRTITAAALTASNVDFEDIVGAGAASWNLSAITGGSGNCGNNSGITFTTPANQYWVPDSGTSTGNYNSTARWASSSGGTPATGRIPLPQDTAIFDASSIDAGSRTITVNMPRIANFDSSAVTNTPSFNWSSGVSFYGDVATGVQNITQGVMRLHGRGSHTLTMGQPANNFATNMTVDCGGGTYTLGSAYKTAGQLSHLSGTFTLNNYNIEISSFSRSGSLTAVLNLGSSDVTVTFSTGNIWAVTGSNFTLNAGTSTILITNTGAAAKTFAGGGLTYYNLSVAGAASVGATTITGTNAFNEIILQPNSFLKFTSGTTTTMTVPPAWVGTSGNNIKIESSTATSAATISVASGTANCDYLTIRDSTATGGATFNGGANSTDVSNNTGWVFGSVGETYNDAILAELIVDDAQGVLLVLNPDFEEETVVSETFTNIGVFNSTFNENLNLEDEIENFIIFQEQITSELQVLEDITASLVLPVFFDEQLQVEDQQQVSNNINSIFSEVLQTEDQLLGNLSFNLPMFEETILSDNFSTLVTFQENLQEISILEDGVTGNFVASVSFEVDLEILDSVTGGSLFEESFSEILQTQDSLSVQFSFSGVFSEQLVISDSLSSIAVYYDTVVEDLLALDSVSAIILGEAISPWIFSVQAIYDNIVSVSSTYDGTYVIQIVVQEED